MAVSPIGTTQNIAQSPTAVEQSDNDMFLQLLVAEMGSQNPMEPMDNQSFMEQLSQFSAMEKTSEMNDNLAELLQFQGLLAAMQGLEQGAAMLGRVVEFKDQFGKLTSGEVESAKVQGNDIILSVDGKSISLGEVIGVRTKEETPATPTNPTTPTTPSPQTT